MPNEKYLDYAGLQYYHEKLNLDLAGMLMTDDDLDIVLLDELGIIPPIPETWTESANGTLNLALGNAFSYWPEGAGIKTISITNGTTAGISKFFLKLTDAGNFPIQWENNIQWKNGNEPVWQAFHEDIIMFKSNDGGNTWTAQVVQTNEIDPYWKITMQAQYVDISKLQYSVPSDYGYFCYLPFPANYLPSDTIIDWGDGTVQTYTQMEYNHSPYMQVEKGQQYMGLPIHHYSNEGIYHIKIQASSFNDVYMVNYTSGDMFVYDGDYGYIAGQEFITSIDSPLPHVNGIWDDYGSAVNLLDNSLGEIFSGWESLQYIPEKLFYNNKLATSFYACFYNCSSLQSIPSGLFDKNTAVISFESCFSSCSSLTDFTLHIGSSLVLNCNSFVTNKSGTTRTIYVPSSSTTQTTFNAQASSLGLTIIGE